MYKKTAAIVSSVVLGLAFIGAAVVWTRSQSPKRPASSSDNDRIILQTELAAADGKEGRDCLVAVDGAVYKIEDSSLWQNGQHSTSGGRAFCGADMSQVITQSPHGKSKLEQLEKLGQLE